MLSDALALAMILKLSTLRVCLVRWECARTLECLGLVKGALSPKFGYFWLLDPKNSPSLKVYHSYFHFAKAWHNFIENMFSNLNNQYLVLGEVYPLNKLIILPCCCLNYLRSLRLYFLRLYIPTTLLKFIYTNIHWKTFASYHRMLT